MTDPTPPRDLRAPFATSPLEPELDHDLLVAYAEGAASPFDAEIVESMMEVDPSLREVVETIRAELADLRAPELRAPKAAPPPRRAPWLLPGLSIAALAAALALVVLGRPPVDSPKPDSALAFARRENADLRDRIAQAKRVVAVQRDATARMRSALLAARAQTAREAAARRLAQAVARRATDALRRANRRPRSKGLVAIQVGGSSYLRTGDRIARLLPAHDPLARAFSGLLEVPPLDLPKPPIEKGPPPFAFTGRPSNTAALGAPVLDWTAAKDLPPGPYVVEILDRGRSIWRAPAPARRIAVPSGLLKPDHAYAWRLLAGDRNGTPLLFRTLSSAAATEARRIAADPTLGPFERGVADARLGLLDDARTEFDAVRETNPALAARLLRRLGR